MLYARGIPDLLIWTFIPSDLTPDVNARHGCSLEIPSQASMPHRIEFTGTWRIICIFNNVWRTLTLGNG
jgi:hypothetical protein